METAVDADIIRRFLTEVGRRYQKPAKIFLLGGSALFLLGNTRPTLDIDYFGHDMDKDDLQQTIDQVAIEMQIDVDAVPLDEFIPIPNGASERHRLFARFGLLEVFLFDPYSISLSKIDRGFDTDIDDVVFLLRAGLLDLQNLEMVVDEALTHAGDYDLIPSTTLTHLAAVRNRYGGG